MQVLTSNLIIFLTLLSCLVSKAQQEVVLDTSFIDTIGISVSNGFAAEDFIRMTKKDTSFYRAFKNLKLFPHISNSEVKIYDKNWGQIAKMNRTADHFSNGKIGWIKVIDENTDGKFYNRKGEYKYFTAEMYDKVFFEKGRFRVSNNVDSAYAQQEVENRSKEEKYYEQLKTFMFSPGLGVEGVPFIGYKLNIFDGKMTKYYDYLLEKTMFRDSIPCYKFTVKIKDGVKKEKVVITNLTTFYDRRTMKVIARSYALKQTTIMFSFDIQMFILLGLQFDEYLPLEIKYNGAWDVPFKKPERISFKMKSSNYKNINQL
jgi:hypothetical protein|tara:strand:- start:1986 stop:2933 length:948 start_codon:yes stop_codon:yes gene_type:complete